MVAENPFAQNQVSYEEKKKVWPISSQFLRHSISDIYRFLKEHKNFECDNIAFKKQNEALHFHKT